MHLPGFAEIKSRLKHFYKNAKPHEPMPADFDMEAAMTKLAYVGGEIDKLVDEYDKKQLKVKQHPDVVQEIKKTVKDVLMVHYWQDLLGDNEKPIDDYTIRQTFDQIYNRAFIECIVSREDTLRLTDTQINTKQSFDDLLVSPGKQQTFQETLQFANDVSANFESMFETKELPESSLIEASPSIKNEELFLKRDKTFRSEDEAIMCKITYNKEKIKFLSAQYAVLEHYLKHAFCDDMTGKQRSAFRLESRYNLQNLNCDTNTETPGDLLKLFDKFNELLLNVEKSKEALEANGMSV
jgi:hypothetical protein